MHLDIFKSNILNLYGSLGESWLRGLPTTVSSIALRYGLAELAVVNNLSYNYVVSGFKDITPIILKLGLDTPALEREAAALKAFAGFGAARVLASEDGMLILERAIPASSLKTYFPDRDSEAIQIACTIIKKLHKASIDHSLPHIRYWLAALDKNWDIPPHFLQKARELRDKLLLSATGDILLHGDLHHDNILQDGTTWMVIDPKGVIGEAAFELAPFIRNPIPELLDSDKASSIIERRITTFAKILGIEETRIRDWCYVEAVLSWAWNLEDHTPRH